MNVWPARVTSIDYYGHDALVDLHLLADPSCLDLLAELVRYVPPGSQIAIASIAAFVFLLFFPAGMIHAVVLAGRAVLPLNLRLTAGELAQQLTDARVDEARSLQEKLLDTARRDELSAGLAEELSAVSRAAVSALF